MMRGFKVLFGVAVAIVLLMVAAFVKPAAAATGEFLIQVYPSPLVATVKPGETSNLEIKVRNGGPQAENLQIAVRDFKMDSQSQELKISDTQAPDIASWVNFSAPTFTVQAGQTITENIALKVPRDAGFSYSFALLISRSSQSSASSGRTLKAQIAVFVLINVDRPGATRSLQLLNFKATQGVYQYLPVRFETQIKNTGNTIVQPSGNIFVQRGSSDKTPLAILDFNQNGGYILPGTSRTFTAEWSDGFLVEAAKSQADGTTKTELSWNWDKLSSLRIGQYTAKLIAVYNDGHRDIPLQAETSFWVVPWLVLLGIVLVVALIGLGVWSLVSKAFKATKRFSRRNKMKF